MITIPDEWLPALERLAGLPLGGIALLIGGTDTGKTTFAALAAQVLAEDSENIAVVDGDIGQSEIAPPGTVGIAWARADKARLSELKPAATFFVGTFSASALPLEHVTAVAKAVRHARARKAERILVDTTGYISGPTARRLKAAKAALIQPNLILVFGDNTETKALAAATAAVCGSELLFVPVLPAVQRKPPAQRATRRQTRLAAYFGDRPQTVPVPLDTVATLGATLGTGEPIAPHLAFWAGDALHLPVVRGEIAGDVLSLFLSDNPRPGWESLSSAVAVHFGVKTVRVVSLPAHEGVLLGLHDDTGRLLALGRYIGYDKDLVAIQVEVPGPTADTVREQTRFLAFGRVRTDGSGATIAEMKPNEL